MLWPGHLLLTQGPSWAVVLSCLLLLGPTVPQLPASQGSLLTTSGGCSLVAMHVTFCPSSIKKFPNSLNFSTIVLLRV